MAKINIKSEKLTIWGGKFHVRDLFSCFVAPLIDKVLVCAVHPTVISTAKSLISYQACSFCRQNNFALISRICVISVP